MQQNILALRKTLLNFLMTATLSVMMYSCANPGIPTGGPKDETPPQVLRTAPENNSIKFKQKRITIQFNEFVQLKDLNEKFIMSPPQKKKPSVKLKGKSIQIEIQDTLKDNTTYTMDFGDAIVDNNEGNPLGDFQYSFSTGGVIDSLRIQGQLQDAFTLQPIENAMVMVYEDHNDSIPLTQVPSYIARTDTAGHFSIKNIHPNTYRIVGIIDNNRDYIFNSPVEPVAFLDSLITPHAQYQESLDTISPDSIILRGYTLFSPADVHLLMFQEKDMQLYLTKYDRPRREKFEFHFNRQRADSLTIDLLDIDEGTNWFTLEHNVNRDTLSYWITDSLISRRDTIMAELQYLKTDSIGQLVSFRDTVKLNFKAPKKAKKPKKPTRKAKKIKIKKPVLEYKAAIPSNMDLNKKLTLEFNEPINNINRDSIHLFMTQDSLEVAQQYQIVQDSVHLRKYHIINKWEPEKQYRLQLDSTAFTNIYGLTTPKMEKKFKTKGAEFYGRILINISNVKAPLVVQLLKSNDKEPIIQSQIIDKDQEVIFPYLYPDKYLIKIIVDQNRNGKWDTGDYLKHKQPETVYYYKSPLKVRSNWDAKEPWILP